MIKICITLIFLLAQLDLLLANLNAKIVIIGGGISGLAAANELNNYGFKDIKILEADFKLGGRANSVPYSNLLF
jgi:monoamine oxidase